MQCVRDDNISLPTRVWIRKEKNMKYTIMTVDDSRQEKKDAIRARLGLDEVMDIDFVFGRDPEQMQKARSENPGLSSHLWHPSEGEEGIWYSQINCWKWAAEFGDLLVFEDDAILTDDFQHHLDNLMTDLPSDWDFFSVFVPENQQHDFYKNVYYDGDGVPHNIASPGTYSHGAPPFTIGSDKIARVYQGYSCVVTGFSKSGGEKLQALVNEFGMYTPVDCFLFLQAHRGNLNGYSPRPDYKRIVSVDWNAPSVRIG